MMPKQKLLPLGQALDLNDEQLQQAAEVSDTDILKAKWLWYNTVDELFVDLLDAQTLEDINAENQTATGQK